jgi:hypothetical protein
MLNSAANQGLPEDTAGSNRIAAPPCARATGTHGESARKDPHPMTPRIFAEFGPMLSSQDEYLGEKGGGEHGERQRKQAQVGSAALHIRRERRSE